MRPICLLLACLACCCITDPANAAKDTITIINDNFTADITTGAVYQIDPIVNWDSAANVAQFTANAAGFGGCGLAETGIVFFPTQTDTVTFNFYISQTTWTSVGIAYWRHGKGAGFTGGSDPVFTDSHYVLEFFNSGASFRVLRCNPACGVPIVPTTTNNVSFPMNITIELNALGSHIFRLDDGSTTALVSVSNTDIPLDTSYGVGIFSEAVPADFTSDTWVYSYTQDAEEEVTIIVGREAHKGERKKGTMGFEIQSVRATSIGND